MISNQPPSHISSQVIYPQAFLREPEAGFVSPWSMEMLAWLRGETRPAPSEIILPDNNVIPFPKDRRTNQG